MSRTKKVLVVVALALLIVGAGAVAVVVFRVGLADQQVVSGNARVDSAAVIEAAAIRRDSVLLTVDQSAVEKRVVESQPWISGVNVVKSWPSTVRLQISERQPVALMATEDKRWARISQEGIVVEVAEKTDPALPLIMDEVVAPTPGARVNDRAMKLLKVGEALPDSLKPKVTQLQLRGDADGFLGLNTGPIVELGSVDDELGAKLTSAATVLAKEDNKKIEVLDVRTPRLPVARPVGVSAPPVRAAETTTTTVPAQRNEQR